MFHSVAVVGLGLIGSSIIRALQRYCPEITITSYDSRIDHRERSQELGLGTVCHDVAEAVSQAELVVIAVPVGAVADVCADIAHHLGQGVTVTDVSSTKVSACQTMRRLLPSHVEVIGGHPIAGTEHSGPDAGMANLFVDHYWLLTPDHHNSVLQVDKMSSLLHRIGAMVEVMDAKHHDYVLAVTSHIPHLIAYTIMHTGQAMGDDSDGAHGSGIQHSLVSKSELLRFSAGGFRDFTRIAASDPVMWRDIFTDNRDCLLEVLDRFTKDINLVKQAVIDGDQEFLEQWCTKGRDIHKRVKDMQGSLKDVNGFDSIPDTPSSFNP